jgi:hypothetical protein
LLIPSPFYVFLHSSNKFLCLCLLLSLPHHTNILFPLSNLRLHVLLLRLNLSLRTRAYDSLDRIRIDLYVISLCDYLHILLFLLKSLQPALLLDLLLFPPLKLHLSLQECKMAVFRANYLFDCHRILKGWRLCVSLWSLWSVNWKLL